MKDNFYRAFEDRHRGSRQLIKNRLRVYLAFVEHLPTLYPGAPALDIGCGRGEWLELLSETGLDPFGVDLDAGMLESCHQLGLKAQKGDAIAYLSGLPTESQAVISAFHVVEHIAFEQLQVLVAQALRVLKPGGLLIMETPNPENIVVATCNFYVDPSHQRPIPPMLLSYLAEYEGFARVKTVRLQERNELVSASKVSLMDVFDGASPDYSIIAQKTAHQDVLEMSKQTFDMRYGLSLEDLLYRLDRRLNTMDTAAQKAFSLSQQAQNAAQQAQATAQQAHSMAQQAQQAQQDEQLLASAQQIYQYALSLENRLVGLYSSRSWRVTSPFRWCTTQYRLLREEGIKQRIQTLIKLTLYQANQQLVRHPTARKIFVGILKNFSLYENLKKLAIENSQIPIKSSEIVQVSEELNNLTPHARKLLEILKKSLANTKEKN